MSDSLPEKRMSAPEKVFLGVEAGLLGAEALKLFRLARESVTTHGGIKAAASANMRGLWASAKGLSPALKAAGIAGLVYGGFKIIKGLEAASQRAKARG